ncbi:Ig-like domain-containing protein [Longimicrobium sp.]|uniref:Ig-like domain-containing protein n=1 Tax=Longimicrobium sp. TaxID=2029185 RepID=UPI002E36DB3A|nr:Ig-like domain-containing protein [Longimicrobium sp.]HEX6037851.1 Ig-like domain-containing protein [Longimicrobium sp.]
MTTARKRIACSALLMGLSLAAACGDTPTQAGGGEGPGGGGNPGPVVDDSGVVDLVRIAPDTLTLLAQGGHRMVQATAFNRYGAALRGRVIGYRSSDASVARVDESGNVTALTPGRVVITASLDGKQAQARVEVLPLTVDSVAVSVRWLQVQWGTTRALGATLYAADGRVLSDRGIAWTTSDPEVATVDAMGRVTALRGGRAWITATSEGRFARAEIIVPDVKQMTLARADGTSLPATLMDSLYNDGNGAYRRVRVVATEGTLRLDSRTGTYEQTVTLRTTVSRFTCTDWGSCIGAGPEQVEVRQVYDRGELLYNVFSGEPIFESSVYEGWDYYAQNAPDDGFTVWQALPGTRAYLGWLYRL